MNSPSSASVRHWHQRHDDAPHAHLLWKNNFFELLTSATTVRLLHITTNIETVVKQKTLSSSTGCLIGSVYCTPLFPTRAGLRAHNLGAYIFEHEVPRSIVAKGISNRAPTALIIEVNIPAATSRSIAGVNYLRMGDVHLQAFQKLQHLMTATDVYQLRHRVVRQIQMARPLLDACHNLSHHNQILTAEYFFELLTRSIHHLPILGYFYFEALTEYIMLFSRDKRSMQSASQGELNSWGYKELVFRACPALLRNFNLGEFRPSLAALIRTVHQLETEGKIAIDPSQFIEHIQQRLSFLVDHCLLNSSPVCLRSLALMDFDKLAAAAAPLLGHAIDREVRRAGRYKDFYVEFDALKARQAWSYWNSQNLSIPFNGILPKGEVGVNPTLQERCKVYQAAPYHIDGDLYLQPQKRLDVRIIPELVKPQLTFMGLSADATT